MAKIAKRRDRWVIDFRDTTGKRRWITMPEGSKKKDANIKLREIEDQLAKGIYIPEKRIPTFKVVAEDWLEYKKPNVRFNTWEKYDGYVRNHYEDILKSKINRITTAKIEKFVSKKQLADMNITTLKKLIVTLNQIFKYAIRHHYIDNNPVASIERPKDQRTEEEKEFIQVLTEDQTALFLEKVDDCKFKVLFLLAVMSGARQSELFGLKWMDIDWENSQVEIKRSFNGRRWYPPKSKKSRRKINIGPAMLSELRQWRVKSFYSKGSDLVFPNSFGKPLDPNNTLRTYFYPALKAAKLPKVRFHDLRHTFASHLLDQGENIVYVSEQLGHQSAVVTLTIYAHVIKPENSQAALRLEERFFKNFGSKAVAENEKANFSISVKS